MHDDVLFLSEIMYVPFKMWSAWLTCACGQVQTLDEQEWDRLQQASVLANVAHAFESDMDMSDAEDDRETVFSSMDLLSGQADAQTLALMLQDQLDAINNEIRYTSHNPSRVSMLCGLAFH